MKNKLLRVIAVSVITLIIGSYLFLPVKGDTSPSEFDAKQAFEHTRVLAQEIGPRPAASAQEQRAGDYIHDRFIEYGWTVKNQDFSRMIGIDKLSLKKFSLVNSRNIIAVRKGKLPDTIVIGAHYDSADFNVPGANDNASGVGVLLELARVLANKPQEYSYVLVGFGAEELGLLGSRYFVDNYDLGQVKLMLNLDMIGDGKKIALDGGGKVSTPPELLKYAYKAAKKYGLNPMVQRDFMLMARTSKDGGTSDFSPFLDKWIPSLGLGQGDKGAAYYHQPSDTLDKVRVENLGSYGNLVLDLATRTAELKVTGPWDDKYLSLDIGGQLLFIPPGVIKGAVIGAIIFAVVWLVRRRRRSWLSITWLVPVMLVLTFLVLLVAYLPELGLQRIKGTLEPWHTFPGAYVLLRGLCVALILLMLTRYMRLLPQKVMSAEPEVYQAASMIILAIGTTLLALSTWEGAFYLALWLALIPLCRYRFGLFVALLAPILLYSLHWQVLNSFLWIEFYRICREHFVIATLVYAVLSLPFILSLQGWMTGRTGLRNPLRPRFAFYCLAIILFGFLLLPSYTAKAPQEITARQEWKEHQLVLQVSSKDRLPLELAKTFEIEKGAKQANMTLQGKQEPAVFKVITTEAKLKEERLITVNVNAAFRQQPYLYRVKLRSDKPFTLVNSGELFPLGKLTNKVNLSGEAFGGVYGLILERYTPVPSQFALYLKAQGQVQLSIEAQYPVQFLKQELKVPGALLKYENWATFTKEI
ncbi:MAG TPA: M28 family metallopeptidase [Candidatus Deferrimicrobium sp.]|nr:M28 family metallopeptidase [Candidatus Deferrimicrobium sp.]